jgi:photosystem II stability/assembly factor-like uncharacterized protein
MRTRVVLVSIALLCAVGCKKKGSGGGGGGWLVGEQGLMANVTEDGELGRGYDLDTEVTLHAIACRYVDEAWATGDGGTLLYTSDAGTTWTTLDLGTTANLRALGTQDAGPVYVAGDGVFFTAVPQFETGIATWTQLGDGVARFRSLAAAQHATTVLAISDDGGVWALVDGRLVRRATIAGARAIAVSPDGATAIVAGDGIAYSNNGGSTWQTITTKGTYHAVRVNELGEGIAVGAGGAVLQIHGSHTIAQTVGEVDLNAIHVMPSGHGYAAGSGGNTWITHDGGETWSIGPNVGHTVFGVDEIGDGHN